MSNLVMLPRAFRVKNVDLTSGDDDYSAKTYNVDLPVDTSIDEEMFITHFDNPFNIAVFSLQSTVNTHTLLSLLYKLKKDCPVGVVMFSTERTESMGSSFSDATFYVEEENSEVLKSFFESLKKDNAFFNLRFSNFFWRYDDNFVKR